MLGNFSGNGLAVPVCNGACNLCISAHVYVMLGGQENTMWMRSMDLPERMSLSHCTQKSTEEHSQPMCSCMLSVQPILAEKHDINTQISTPGC